MATVRISMLNGATVPDNSGDVYLTPLSNFTTTNDRWPHMVVAFDDTGTTRIGCWGAFNVPKDYNSGATLVIVWSTAATGSFDVEWDFEYRAVGGNDSESFDQSGQHQSLNQNDTAPSAAHERMEVTISLTAGNFAADDTVQFQILRDCSDSGDTISDTVYIVDLLFQYTT